MTVEIVRTWEWCAQDTFFDRHILSFFLLFPLALAFSLNVVYLIRDIFVFLLGHFLFQGLWILLYIASVAIEQPRPMEVHKCDSSFAVPDPTFVAVMAFILVLITVWCVYRVPSWGQYLSIAAILLISALYATALVRGSYFTVGQLFINLAIVVPVALILFFLIIFIFEPFVRQLRRYWLVRYFGFCDVFFSGDYGKPAPRRGSLFT